MKILKWFIPFMYLAILANIALTGREIPRWEACLYLGVIAVLTLIHAIKE